MARDITYCQGIDCSLTQNCERFVDNLMDASSKTSYFSMTTTFIDEKGKCDYYVPIDDAFYIPTKLKSKTKVKRFKCRPIAGKVK